MTAVVIGAGPAGVAAAHALVDAGCAVLALDAGDTIEPGGMEPFDGLARSEPERWPAELVARVRGWRMDRVSLSLLAVFLFAAVFYLWTAGSTYPLSLHGPAGERYDQLARALLHLHLSIGRAPARLLALADPYNPVQNAPFQAGYKDLALYHGRLFIPWGPAPALVLVAPLELVGFVPSSSLTASIFAIAGLAFTLAALRVVLAQIGPLPTWMCALAACTLALGSAVPFILRRPLVYEEEIAGGYCFAMAGVWLALRALRAGRGSWVGLATMSLCIGLAAGARPTYAFAAVVLVPVYRALRHTRPRRGLVLALAAPLGVCGVLLLAYNQARFGSPLQNGAKYQLAGSFDQHTARFGALAYTLPGLWFYGFSPPQLLAVFPFVSIGGLHPGSYPGVLPVGYFTYEPVAGLLPMTPIVAFLAALPWLWRRRPRALGALAAPLLLLAGAGAASALFLAYVFFSTSERYEVDFTTLLLFGALAAWLALARHTPRGWRRALVRFGGGALAAWSCLTGLAIGFTGAENLLATRHPGTWRTLQTLTSPLAHAIATADGRPAPAAVFAPPPPGVADTDDRGLIVALTLPAGSP